MLWPFFLLTLPLSAWLVFDSGSLEKSGVGVIYFAVLGTTHFLLTFSLYLQNENREYFSRGAVNRFIYWACPIAILSGFALYGAFGVPDSNFDKGLRFGVRALNVFHFSRQSFGVLQLITAGTGAKPRRALLHWTFLLLGALLVWSTIVSPDVAFASSEFKVLGSIVLGLVVLCAINLRPKTEREGWNPLFYFLIQTGSAGIAVFFPLAYAFCQATHYVEYHVLMHPRCFNGKLGPQEIDRAFGRLRSDPLLLYLSLGLFAVIASLMLSIDKKGLDWSTAFLLSCFDGIFVFHFFLDGFIWRFSNPFFKKTALPYYAGAARG